MAIVAVTLLRRAAERGWTFKVIGGDDDDYDYVGNQPLAAWKAVTDQDEARVRFYDGAQYLGWAYLMAPGPGSCADDETICDYTCNGPFGALCDALTEEG